MAILDANYSDIDFEKTAASIGIQATYMPMLINSFLTESEKLLNSLKLSIEQQNWSDVSMYAHSLRGSAGNLQFNEIHDMAKEIEIASLESNETFEYSTYCIAIEKIIATIQKV